MQFLEDLARYTGGCAADERFICCAFPGDPQKARASAWRPRAWKPGQRIAGEGRLNGYVAASTFGRAEDGTWRRRNDLFRSGRFLMVDDVGTKVPRRAVERLPPTAVLETSPGNFQWLYWFGEPERNGGLMKAVIDAFVDQMLLGVDSGMKGVNRVARLPGFINGKPQHLWWTVKLREFEPSRLYGLREAADALGVVYRVPRPRRPALDVPAEAAERFAALRRSMDDLGLVRTRRGNRAGWIEVLCPWREEHSNRAATGASLRVPAAENDFAGAFVCHHGHCKDRRGIGDVQDWIAQVTEEANGYGRKFEKEMWG